MKVTLLKNHSYSLDGRNVIAGKKGDVVEVSEDKAAKWAKKGVAEAPKKAKPVTEKKVVSPVEETKEAPKPKTEKKSK